MAQQLVHQAAQAEFDEDKKLCSGCGIHHRVRGGACEGCFWVRCPRCRLWNRMTPAGRIRCANPWCGERWEMSRREVRLMTHPDWMTHCNLCGKRLRQAPRDKRRGRELKG